MNEDNHLLNERAAATRLGVSPALLRKWRNIGGGPRIIRLGRCVRYQPRDLDAFLERHAEGGEGR